MVADCNCRDVPPSQSPFPADLTLLQQGGLAGRWSRSLESLSKVWVTLLLPRVLLKGTEVEELSSSELREARRGRSRVALARERRGLLLRMTRRG